MVCDWRWRRIPHGLTVGGSGVAWLTAAQLPAQTVPNALIGGAIIFLLLLLIRTVGKQVYGRTVLGFGDVMLGWFIGNMAGVVVGLYAISIGMLLAGGFAIVGLWCSRLTRESVIPYGVFLAAGALVSLLASYYYWRLFP